MTTARRVGLVGCGRWGRHILDDLLALGCTSIVADSSESARADALRAGAAEAVPSATALPPVDGVVVATPTRTHAAIIHAVAPRARPIFCEKPLTADVASAEGLGAVLRAPLFVMDKWRYHGGIECLRDLVRSQVLGPVRGLRTTRFGWEHAHDDVDPVWILAPHDLSIALEVLGNIPEPVAAVAECATGRITGLTAVLGSDPWMVLDVSTLNGQRRRSVELHCRDGIAILADAYAEHVSIVRHAASASEVAPAPAPVPIRREMPLLRELRVFVEYLDGGPPPRSTVADGVRVVQVLATLCARAGRPTAPG